VLFVLFSPQPSPKEREPKRAKENFVYTFKFIAQLLLGVGEIILFL